MTLVTNSSLGHGNSRIGSGLLANGLLRIKLLTEDPFRNVIKLDEGRVVVVLELFAGRITD